MKSLRIKRSNAGVSTIVAEMLILALTVILAAAFVASLDSNVSYYVQSKPLSEVKVWTTQSNNVINFTTIDEGGDPTSIQIQVYFESQDASSKALSAQLTYYNVPLGTTGNDVPQQETGTSGVFKLSNFEFGQFFVISVDMNSQPSVVAGTAGTIWLLVSSPSQILAQEEVPVAT